MTKLTVGQVHYFKTWQGLNWKKIIGVLLFLSSLMVLLVEHVTEPVRISEANTDEGLEGQPQKNTNKKKKKNLMREILQFKLAGCILMG